MRTAHLTARARVGVAVAIAALVASGLTACTDATPDPRPAAQALADALRSGDFSDVPLAPGAPSAATLAETRAAVVEGLGESTATAELGALTVAEDDSAATAPLTVTWDLPGVDEDWTYSATVQLVRAEESAQEPWLVSWALPLLAPDLVPGERLTLTRQAAERGVVLGRQDAVLVEPRPVRRVGIDKTRLAEDQLDEAARALAAALGTDAEAYAARVVGAGPKAFVEAIVVRDGDPGYDIGALSRLTGVVAIADELPLALTRTFARPVLGAVGAATAEIVEASDGEVVGGDLAGLSGLQRRYDRQLRGTPGIVLRAVNEAGNERVLHTVEAVPGTPLRTTIDPALQQRAEDVLAGVGPASALVAVQPSTGDVLAVASGPGSEGLSTATVGQYAPGSTFKVVSALAYLRAGLTPDSLVACPPTVTVDGRSFQNFPGYPAAALGDVPFRTAFANSCNTAFIGSRDLADQADLLAAARSLGLEPAVDLGFAAFLGTVPDEASGTGHAASVIGQGQVLASPLGMATVAASVAAGRTVVPRLVVPDASVGQAASGTDPSSEESPQSPSPEGSPLPDATPLTGDEAEALRTMMRAVVTEGGGGILADVPGDPVMAKTGTAQFGADTDLKNHAWLVAVQGDLAVAVFVAEGEYGSTTAGPLVRAFLGG